MTDDERSKLADNLFALVCSLRPTDSREVGDAWVLHVFSTGLARAILANLGPTGDPDELLGIAAEAVRTVVKDTQSKFLRDRLSAPVRES